MWRYLAKMKGFGDKVSGAIKDEQTGAK